MDCLKAISSINKLSDRLLLVVKASRKRVFSKSAMADVALQVYDLSKEFSGSARAEAVRLAVSAQKMSNYGVETKKVIELREAVKKLGSTISASCR